MSEMEWERREPHVFTVSELTTTLQRLVEPMFEDVRVAGELSAYKVWPSGHAYFTIKDGGAVLRGVMWKSTLRYLRFRPKDGVAVVARGSLEVRKERGEYQFIVSSMEPQGVGELQQAFEELKRRLAEEGLFAAERKRPLPRYPRRIGIVTSPKGAVIRDMLTVLGRRWPGLEIRLFPTAVQGEGAIDGLCEGLLHFGQEDWADVIIVGRGGGSLEDLWAFNEEAVARAIAVSQVPVISAVGHETDFTIADFVADLRAPTPSAAAEMVVEERALVERAVAERRARLARAVRYRLSRAETVLGRVGLERATRLVERRLGRAGQRLDEARARLQAQDPRVRLGRRSEQLERLRRRLEEAMRVRLSGLRRRLDASEPEWARAAEARLQKSRLRLEPAVARLEAMSPLKVLERGYAIVTTAGGEVVREAAQAPAGTELDIRLRRERVRAVAG